MSNEPYLEVAPSGFRKLRLPRNHPRVSQTSLDMVSSWRANCDLQILLYDSHPDDPSHDEIARVTDYIVGYACKGAKTLKQEREQIKAFINR